ncbi:MAG: protein-disulfide reductase DsbD N-terminal domain-containing protein [Acidobacteria bacterium]|nr:protein-disulfide reductase DsbD N-terminal domain-containing protein [Acidobacteriota bacterium]
MRFVAACLLMCFAPGVRLAAQPRPVVEVQTFLAANAAHPDSEVRAAVVARIAFGYHINSHHPSLDYLIPTKVAFKNTAALKVDRVAYPQGKPKKFDFLDSPISVYEGEARVGAILRVSRLLQPGTYKLHGNFAYQACNDHACLAPAEVPFEITVRVAPAGVPVKPANAEVFRKINFP